MTTSVCAGCGQPPDSRGLVRDHCNACYRRNYRRGAHIDLPRRNRSRTDVVDDYLLLRSEGYTRRQIAARLGMNRNALEQALKRAALAGDTRIDYTPRTAVA